MSKKVLVTGGAGYIGSHIVRELLARNWQVGVLDNLFFGDNAIQNFNQHNNFRLIHGDIRHIEDLVTAMNGCDAVIHLAAIVGDKACDLNREATRTVNYEATKALVEICKYYGVKRLLFASTCSVYGDHSRIILNEGSMLSPTSLYATTRIQSEKIILSSVSDITTPVVLRLATVYGMSERMRFDLVVNIFGAKAASGEKLKIYGGDQWRPVIHVQDVADAFVKCLEAPRKSIDREIFNVGSNDQNYQVGELAELTREVFPEVELQFCPKLDDERNYRVSFDKIKYLLGFEAKKSVIDGVSEVGEAICNGIIRNYRDEIYYNINYQYK